MTAPDGRLSARELLPWLERECPNDQVDRGGGSCGPRFCTLDTPIYGTEGLLRGGQYVIALALVVDGNIEVGTLGCPRLSVTTGPPPSEDTKEGDRTSIARDEQAWQCVAEKLRGGAEKRAIRRAERTWSIKYRIHMGTARQKATGLQLRSRGEQL